MNKSYTNYYSPWLAITPATDFPEIEKNCEVDTVIVGGGMPKDKKRKSDTQIAELEKQAYQLLFQTVQSDHGPEFSTWFTEQLELRDLAHRHSRVRRPNNNAHLERFNRTLQ